MCSMWLVIIVTWLLLYLRARFNLQRVLVLIIISGNKQRLLHFSLSNCFCSSLMPVINQYTR